MQVAVEIRAQAVGTTLWLFNIAMEAMAHRNRWFTMVYLLNMVIFHGYVSHNQMVLESLLVSWRVSGFGT